MQHATCNLISGTSISMQPCSLKGPGPSSRDCGSMNGRAFAPLPARAQARTLVSRHSTTSTSTSNYGTSSSAFAHAGNAAAAAAATPSGSSQRLYQHGTHHGASDAGAHGSGLHGSHSSNTASMSRVLVGTQPSMLRGISGGRRRVNNGPMMLLMFLFALAGAIWTAVKAYLVRRVKNCRCCRGYGIIR